MATPMSDEEAKKEVEDINREIAESKGIKIDPPAPEITPKEEEPEPKDDAADDLADDVDDDKTLDQDEDEVTPTPVRKPKSLLAKLQETKRIAREAADAKDKEISDLKLKLASQETEVAMQADIKTYAEKYGMSEEQVKDQLAIFQKTIPKPAIDPNPIIDKAAILLQKEEAKEAFENEFSDLYEELPETKDHKDAIRKESYKPENLQKSLYEIYQRMKPTITVKKKTGESGRGGQGRGDSHATLDFAKIAENVKNSVPGALKDLSGEQQDKLFEWMAKQGSRYN